MKTANIILTACFLTVTSLHAQTFEWATSLGGSSADDANSITVDAFGNVYTIGTFYETVDFDPGTGTTNLTAFGSDIFVQKLDASGNFVWAKSFGSASNDFATSISLDVSGNIYTTGHFAGTADFDPGAGTTNLTSVGGTDIFIQKMDASGNFLWAKSFGSPSNDRARTIATDASGNLYTMGYFRDSADFDPGTGVVNLISAGQGDIFLQKLGPSGNLLWAKSFGGTADDVGGSMKIHASGKIYVTGYFSETADFDPGAGTTNLTSAGSTDFFIQMLDTSGNFIWAKSIGGTSYDQTYSISSDPSGNSYILGTFGSTVDFDPGAGTTELTVTGSLDIFIEKLDASGNFIWVKSFEVTNSNYALGLSIYADASGNVYTTGTFEETMDFDPGTGTEYVSSTGIGDIFIHKMDASGNFMWVKSFSGTATADEIGKSIYVDASGNIYTTGRFRETIDFSQGLGTGVLTSAGNYDVFVLKISQGTSGLDEQKSLVNVSAYPNPTSGTIRIAFEQAENKVELILVDLQGKIISTQNFDVLLNTAIQLPDPAGVYFLNVKTSDGHRILRLVKE